MTKKYLWEMELSKDEWDLVVSIDELAWRTARASTPYKYRKNELAVDRSYSFVLKCVLRAAKTYDPSKSGFSAYALNMGRKSATSQWKRASSGFAASLDVIQENEKNVNLLDYLAHDPSTFTDDALADQELLDRCMDALRAFRPKWHLLVTMRYRLDGNDLSNDEINLLCGISNKNHANLIISKARQFMKSYADGLR